MEKVKLTKLILGGQALGELPSGKKVLVWGALPEEEAEITIYKNKKTYAEATAAKILVQNPARVAPKDECYLSTSPFQIMDFQYELQQKSALIQQAFAQAHLEITPPAIKTDGKDYFYRNKMEYSLWWDNDQQTISLAFHQRGTHRKFPIQSSSLERPEIWAEAIKVVQQLNTDHREARAYQSLLIRCDQSGKTSGALLENGKPHPKIRPLSDQLLRHTYSYSPNGFFQINLPVYEMALVEIQKHITTEKVVDMYSGVGTIGLSVAPDHDLTLVETDPSAFQELQKNAADFHDSRLNLVHAKSEDALDYITRDICLILDPPRAGLHAKVIAKILQSLPPKIIYLSCNPATQARDVGLLAKNYRIASVTAFNFFPRTPHIENLIVLEAK
jgi:23S rRNA (uracil1939-C5)-methyltransferase